MVPISLAELDASKYASTEPFQYGDFTFQGAYVFNLTVGSGFQLKGRISHGDAAELLKAQGIEASIWDPRVISPADPAMVDDAAGHGLVVTAEDGIRLGGAGTHLIDAIEHQARALGLDVPQSITLGVPKAFLAHGKPEIILAGLGLDGPGICASVLAGLSGRSLPRMDSEALEH